MLGAKVLNKKGVCLCACVRARARKGKSSGKPSVCDAAVNCIWTFFQQSPQNAVC